MLSCNIAIHLRIDSSATSLSNAHDENVCWWLFRQSLLICVTLGNHTDVTEIGIHVLENGVTDDVSIDKEC
jgi:hypothetical protein